MKYFKKNMMNISIFVLIITTLAFVYFKYNLKEGATSSTDQLTPLINNSIINLIVSQIDIFFDKTKAINGEDDVKNFQKIWIDDKEGLLLTLTYTDSGIQKTIFSNSYKPETLLQQLGQVLKVLLPSFFNNGPFKSGSSVRFCMKNGVLDLCDDTKNKDQQPKLNQYLESYVNGKDGLPTEVSDIFISKGLTKNTGSYMALQNANNKSNGIIAFLIKAYYNAAIARIKNKNLLIKNLVPTAKNPSN